MTKKLKRTSKNILKSQNETVVSPIEEVFDFSDVVEKEEASSSLGEDDAPINSENYEDRYVVFLDILGFKELIAASARDNPTIQPSMIFSALDIHHASIKDSFFSLIATQSPKDEVLDFRVHSFSDCVVASCLRTPLGLGLLLFFCWQISSDWLSKSFLSRGGVTAGKLLHKKNDGGAALIFGPAFNQAYKLESEVADLPRVILSKEVREACLNIQTNADPKTARLAEVSKALTTPFPDGPTGIDIFAHLRNGGIDNSTQSYEGDAAQYKEALTSRLYEASDTPHFFRKVNWLVGRFNQAILKSVYADKHIDS
jgi:hypothetical protein